MSGSEANWSDDDPPGHDDAYGVSFQFDVTFSAPNVCKREQAPLVDTDKYWQWVKNGFNYGGICSNSSCISHNEDDGMVVCHRGYGSIRPNEDVLCGLVRCRACRSEFQPTEFIIKKATGEMTYMATGGTTLNTVRIRSIANDYCQVIGENLNQKWYSLMIFILKTPTAAVHVIPRSNMDEVDEPMKVTWSRKIYEEAEAAKIKLVDPASIRYCQHSIKNKFQCGRLLSHTLWELKKGKITASGIPLISIFKMGGLWYTSDNRRLWVFKQIAKDNSEFRIPVKVITQYQVKPSKLRSTKKKITAAKDNHKEEE